jgi:SAM-dependent methyltransferase
MIEVLRRRPRLRRVVQRLAQWLTAAVTLAEDGAPAAAIPGTHERAPRSAAPAATEAAIAQTTDVSELDPGRFARGVDRGWLAVETFPVTARLHERLDTSDVAAIEAMIADDPELSSHYAGAADELARRQQLLAYGVWLGHESATQRTGLVAAEPPENVHVMARGPLAAAGGLYEADIICSALSSVGIEIGSLSAGLDFGCSSGRVVRVLAAAYPEVEWHACDPNEPAISWASEHLPQVKFFVSGNAPPLPLQSGSLDLAYAISIWSHFAPDLGLRWFDEMRRVIRPGGHLICTTHGLTSVGHYATLGLRTPEQSKEIAEALYRLGWWYTPEFGEEGDWGVINADWGTAFLGPEWILTQLCPNWRVVEFAPGRNQENQDVYVLERA